MDTALNPNANLPTDGEVDALYDRVFVSDLGMPRWLTRNMIGQFLATVQGNRRKDMPDETTRVVLEWLFGATLSSLALTPSEAETFAAIKVRLFDVIFSEGGTT